MWWFSLALDSRPERKVLGDFIMLSFFTTKKLSYRSNFGLNTSKY